MSLHSHPASPNGLCAVAAQPPSPAPRTAHHLLACVVAARELNQQALPPPTSLRQGYFTSGKVTLWINPCQSVHAGSRLRRGLSAQDQR
jgi:hypothetical protein